MKRLLIIAIAIAAFSSSIVAQELPPVGETNMSHSYELVGTIDGCRVWKINYWGNNVFVTRCPGMGDQISQTQWTENCGKNCTRQMLVATENE